VADPAGTFSVYLDAQQLSYFMGPDTGPHPGHALRRLRQAVKAGHIELVGSLELLQVRRDGTNSFRPSGLSMGPWEDAQT